MSTKVNFNLKISSFLNSIIDDKQKAILLLKSVLEKYKTPTKKIGQIKKGAILITYADQVKDFSQSLTPILSQQKWLKKNIGDCITSIHLLPFFPFSSDDGFSVINYKEINPFFGNWNDIKIMSESYNLMFDLVLNHCSKEHKWFIDFLNQKEYAKEYFLEVNPHDEWLKKVVRPRATPLVHNYKSINGVKSIWTTFSKDQVDLNFKNPSLLAEIIDILMFYIENGAKYIRLDAVTFAIKKKNTNCSSIPQTHQLVKLIRYIISVYAPKVILITETNVPHMENISYFGDGDEAHMVYNFALPVLLIHAILKEEVTAISNWAKTLGDIPKNCSYFNITATHDGIGVRGASSWINSSGIEYLSKICKDRGGKVIGRTNSRNEEEVYELNITFFDILNEQRKREDKEAIDKFMLSQIFTLTLKGIPGIYFHNLLGSSSWHQGFKNDKKPRTLNRQKFTNKELDALLEDSNRANTIFKKMKKILKLYNKLNFFDPHVSQKITQINDKVLMIERIATNGKILKAFFNFSSSSSSIKLAKKSKDILSQKNIEKNSSIEPWQAIWVI